MIQSKRLLYYSNRTCPHRRKPELGTLVNVSASPRQPSAGLPPTAPRRPQLPGSWRTENPHRWRALSRRTAGTARRREAPTPAEERRLTPRRSPQSCLLEQCNSDLPFTVSRFCPECFNCTRQLKRMFKNEQSRTQHRTRKSPTPDP